MGGRIPLPLPHVTYLKGITYANSRIRGASSPDSHFFNVATQLTTTVGGRERRDRRVTADCCRPALRRGAEAPRADEIDLPFAAGSRLGPYEEILTALGAGRNEVYKANDMRVDRTVAIKVLPEALAADPRFRERFDRKARAISQLTHSHIARPVMSPPSTAPRFWLWRLVRATKCSENAHAWRRKTR